jgi:hypothetical protein
MLLGSAAASSGVLFWEDFSGPIDSARWLVPVGPESYYGRTQIRPGSPLVKDGSLLLMLDLHNPSALTPGDSFFGSEVSTRQAFARGAGLRLEVRARLEPGAPAGLVGGIFLYRQFDEAGLHDEIDLELLSGLLRQVHTNWYTREPHGVGHPSMAAGPEISEFNVYRIDWEPEAVRWFVNDRVVREERVVVPSEALHIHLNLWAPDCEGWSLACDTALVPAVAGGGNRTHWLEVDWVRVSAIGGP